MPRPPSPAAAAVCPVLLATVLLAACGAVDDLTDGTETSQATGASVTGSGAGADDEPDEDDTGFDWTDWGPSDPPIPGQYAALAQSPPDCDAAQAEAPAGEYWQTVLAVCRAVTDQGPWPTTTVLPSPPAADNEFQACLDEELSQAVGAALLWHEANPGETPEVTYGSPSSLSPCQTRIYDVRVLADSDLFDEESPPVGTGVRITLALADGDDRDALPVTVAGEPVPHSFDFRDEQPDGVGLASLVVLVPDHLLSASASVTVRTARGDLTTTADLGGAPTTESSTGTATSSDTATESDTGTSGVEPSEPLPTTDPAPGPDPEPTDAAPTGP
jgi:hypothetical protein